jgi:hypothetical protein
MFSLSFTFQFAARILKFIWSKKLKLKNNIEYCKITQDIRNLSQKRIVEIIFQKTKSNIEKQIEKDKKFLVNTDFTILILWYSFFATISENTGNKNQKIGPIIIKGIQIMLR